MRKADTFMTEWQYHDYNNDTTTSLRFVADGRNVTKDFLGEYVVEVYLWNEIEQNNTFNITVHLISDEDHVDRRVISSTTIKEPWKYATPILKKFIQTQTGDVTLIFEGNKDTYRKLSHITKDPAKM